MLRLIDNWDRYWLLKINGWHSPLADRIMWFASGDISWLPFYALISALLIVKYGKRSWLMILMVAPLILASDQVASHLIKPLVLRLRPSHEPGLQDQLRYLHQYRGGDYGFVSSHACNVFALATYLTLVAKRIRVGICAILFIWATGVSYSRVYLGVHYPSDVIVAALIGILIAILIAFCYTRLERFIFHPKPNRSCG